MTKKVNYLNKILSSWLILYFFRLITNDTMNLQKHQYKYHVDKEKVKNVLYIYSNINSIYVQLQTTYIIITMPSRILEGGCRGGRSHEGRGTAGHISGQPQPSNQSEKGIVGRISSQPWPSN